MSQTDRTDKRLPPQPDVARDAHEELQEEIRSSGVKPLEPNINRDRARGDRDRTGEHGDEEV